MQGIAEHADDEKAIAVRRARPYYIAQDIMAGRPPFSFWC
jgi:hypothetical protein